MVPGWNGGKALPFGGSFGEYSLNDLEEQPARRGRTQVSQRHLIPAAGKKKRRWRDEGPALLGCPDLYRNSQAPNGTVPSPMPVRPTGAQSLSVLSQSSVPRGRCSWHARERLCPIPPPPPQPFRAAPNPTDLTRESHGIFLLTFLSPWRRVNNRPAGGSPGSHHLPLRQASGHRVRDGRRCHEPVPPHAAASLAP